ADAIVAAGRRARRAHRRGSGVRSHRAMANRHRRATCRDGGAVPLVLVRLLLGLPGPLRRPARWKHRWRARRPDRSGARSTAVGGFFQHAAVDEREGGRPRSVHACLLALLSHQASSRGSAGAHTRADPWRVGGHPVRQPGARQPWQSDARGSSGERSASFVDDHSRTRRSSVLLGACAMIGRIAIAVASIEAVLTAVTVTIALDIYAHRRVEELGGVNMWGYRGAVAPQRQPNDIRIEVVGGTRAYGWGEPAGSLGSQIRRLMMLAIDRPGAVVRPVTVVNVGRLGALPDSYPAAIEHYAYLQPDIICIYDDLGVRGGEPAERSAIFELTSYAPALP